MRDNIITGVNICHASANINSNQTDIKDDAVTNKAMPIPANFKDLCKQLYQLMMKFQRPTGMCQYQHRFQ